MNIFGFLKARALYLYIMLLGLIFHSPLFAQAPKELGIEVVTPPTIESGQPANIKLNLSPYRIADYLVAEVSSEGVLESSLNEQLNPSNTLTLNLTVATNDDSAEGMLTIKISGFAASGIRLFSRTTQLYAVEENGTIFFNTSSPLYAKLAAQQSSGLQRKPGSGSLFQATALETNLAIPATKRRAAEAFIDKAFPIPAQKPQLKPVTMTVNGTIKWTDSAGKTHALPGALVEIFDQEAAGDKLLVTTTTNAIGGYSAIVDHDDAVEGPDIYVKVSASSTISDIKPDTSVGLTYFMQSTVHENQEDGTTLTVNLTADNTSTSGQAFSIHHALVAGGAYISLLNGSAPAKLTTRFPTTESTSLFDGTELHILQLDRWDWDVTLHEYGHYVMDAYNFENNPGGSHSSGTNLSTTRGSKDIGVRLAWGEGWPTFFAVSGLNQMGFAALGIPNVGDMQYQDTEDTSITNHLENDAGVGEDDELSVMTALWDIVDATEDGEKITLSSKALFSKVKTAGATKIGDVWNALVNGESNEKKAAYGKLFGLHKIAPEQLTPGNRAELSTSTNFTWNKNGAGPNNPLNDNHVRFFASDFKTETHDASVGNASSYTPSAADITAATSKGSLVRWVVTGKNTSTPTTPGTSSEYWSDARVLNGAPVVFVIDDTGSMSEEISGVSSALVNYIDTLSTVETPPTIHLLTFKDGVSHRLTTNDLDAMRNAVNALSASGGGDCPEASAHGLEAASKLVADGGTILLATDASAQPGVDTAAVVTDLRSRGVTVNTILSGDCSSFEGDFKPSLVADIQQKPGSDTEGSEASGAIDEPGSAASVDIIGDGIASASEILLNNVFIGAIEESTDKDVFKLSLAKDKTYTIALSNTDTSFNRPRLKVLSSDGTALNLEQSGFNTTEISAFRDATTTATFIPESDDTFYIELSATGDVSYRFIVSNDEFSSLTASSVKLFSVVSAETGGTFAKIDEVNAGDDSEYVSTIFNILRSSTEAAIITTSVNKIPRGARATMILTGLNTNWSTDDTTVSFAHPTGSELSGISISDLKILSPTSLSFVVEIANDATLATLNIIAKTSLGGDIETAEGKGLIKVEAASTTPRLLSLTPARLIKGSTATLTIQGVNTSFTSTMPVSLGEGVTVNSVTKISDTEATVSVNVDSNAIIGFRTLSAGGNSLREALLIGAESTVPVLSSLSPQSLAQGQTASVTITGKNTHFAASTTKANFGDDITINSIKINSPTEAIVNVTIAGSATVGFRDVSLVTDGETATRLNGLFISKQSSLMVPNVVGKTQADAIAAIEAAGLTVGSIITVRNTVTPSGSVITQTPPQNSNVNAGSSVSLVISTGKGGASMNLWLLLLISGLLLARALNKRGIS